MGVDRSLYDLMNEPTRTWSSEAELAAAVGSRVKSLREERGLSQRALAQHLQVSSSTIAKYEAGVHTPPLAVLVRLAAILDVSLDQLAGIGWGGGAPSRGWRPLASSGACGRSPAWTNAAASW